MKNKTLCLLILALAVFTAHATPILELKLQHSANADGNGMSNINWLSFSNVNGGRFTLTNSNKGLDLYQGTTLVQRFNTNGTITTFVPQTNSGLVVTGVAALATLVLNGQPITNLPPGVAIIVTNNGTGYTLAGTFTGPITGSLTGNADTATVAGLANIAQTASNLVSGATGTNVSFFGDVVFDQGGREIMVSHNVSTLASGNNVLNLGSNAWTSLSTSTGFTLNALDSDATIRNGDLRTIFYFGPNAWTIANESGFSGTSSKRIRTGTGGDLSGIGPFFATFYYYPSRWYLASIYPTPSALLNNPIFTGIATASGLLNGSGTWLDDTNYLVITNDLHFSRNGIYQYNPDLASFSRINDGGADVNRIDGTDVTDGSGNPAYTNLISTNLTGTYVSVDGNSYAIAVRYGTRLSASALDTSTLNGDPVSHTVTLNSNLTVTGDAVIGDASGNFKLSSANDGNSGVFLHTGGTGASGITSLATPRNNDVLTFKADGSILGQLDNIPAGGTPWLDYGPVSSPHFYLYTANGQPVFDSRPSLFNINYLNGNSFVAGTASGVSLYSKSNSVVAVFDTNGCTVDASGNLNTPGTITSNSQPVALVRDLPNGGPLSVSDLTITNPSSAVATSVQSTDNIYGSGLLASQFSAYLAAAGLLGSPSVDLLLKPASGQNVKLGRTNPLNVDPSGNVTVGGTISGNGSGLTSIPGTITTFTSTNIYLDTVKTNYTIPHGLGAQPFAYNVYLLCVTNDAASGYLANDRLKIENVGAQGLLVGNGTDLQTSVNSSNIILSLDQAFDNGGQWEIQNKSGGGAGPISFNNFRLLMTAWKVN